MLEIDSDLLLAALRFQLAILISEWNASEGDHFFDSFICLLIR